jgi:hypothetical protein
LSRHTNTSADLRLEKPSWFVLPFFRGTPNIASKNGKVSLPGTQLAQTAKFLRQTARIVYS